MPNVFTSEEEVNAALRAKYQAPEWTILFNVSNATGARASRYADAVAMSLWPSRGLEIQGFEVKVSRADLQRELKNPKKAEAVACYCDRWWLVAGSKEIVKPEELPLAWGLMVPHGKGLRIVKQAQTLKPKKIDRAFVASLLRRASEEADRASSKAYASVRVEAIKSVEKEHKDEVEYLTKALAKARDEMSSLQESIQHCYDVGLRPEMVTKALVIVRNLQGWNSLSKLIENSKNAMKHVAERIQKSDRQLDEVLEFLEQLEEKASS